MDNIFGKRIRRLRRDKDITMEEMAKVLNTTQATISRYETGVRNPDVDFLNALSEYFNVSTDYLLGKTDVKKTATKYPDADKFIKEIREEVAKYGYDIKGKTNEDIAKMIVKGLKLDEINNI